MQSGETFATNRRLAVELRAALVDLGPSFVKVGQMLASRVDLMPDTYVVELNKLTDQVDPFPVEEAEQILEREWGSSSTAAQALLESGGLPQRPSAAASLSQVYHLDLQGYGDVAVKVQRPGIGQQIIRDLFLLRKAAALVQRFSGLNTDFVALVDEYGQRLLDELNFSQEAANAQAFQTSVQELGLAAACGAAQPLLALTTTRVLVTEWVDGERLEEVALRDHEEAVRLQGVALSAYLAMLLETGTLHADPHGGNLLRARCGRLVIIDWGLVTHLGKRLRKRLHSYLAHVLAKDYEAVPRDLVELGFILEAKKSSMDEAAMVKAISNIFRQLASGGSVKRRVADVLPVLARIRRRHGSVGQVPAPFVYILRAFSILEGHGLRLDDNYRIVGDCYPYLASWIARAPGEETRPLIRALLYGPYSSHEYPVPHAEQIMTMASGVASYLAQTAPEKVSGNGRDRAPPGGVTRAGMEWLMKAHALREVILEELARLLDVSAREAAEVWVGHIFPAAVPRRTEEDKAVLASLDELSRLLVRPSNTDGAGGDQMPAWAELLDGVVKRLGNERDVAELLRALPDARPLLVGSSLRLTAELYDRAMIRLGFGGSSQHLGKEKL